MNSQMAKHQKPPLVKVNEMKVIIADDSSIIRERLVILLAGIPGIEVVGLADNIQSAATLIKQSNPDVLLLDIQMPGGSGIQLLQQLKEESPAPLVMMITANAFPQYRKRCLEAGADYFFDKSSDFKQIRETLLNLLPRFASNRKNHPTS